MDSLSVMREIADLQIEYKKLVDSKHLSKKAMCELCIPFRDKYRLTGKQTLMIARQEFSVSEIFDLMSEKGEN